MTKVTPQIPALAGMTPLGFTPITPKETPAMSNRNWIVTTPNGSTYTVWAHSKAGAIEAARYHILAKTDEGWHGCADVRPVA
jgi:hypothetical protein